MWYQWEENFLLLYLAMNQKEIQDALIRLRDEKPAHFAIKQFKEGDDISIDANRNGILTFCNLLLNSIDNEHLEKTDTYDFPDSFWDESNLSISIQIQEGNRNKSQIKESLIEQTGCFVIAIASIAVLIVGIVTSFKWLVNVLD